MPLWADFCLFFFYPPRENKSRFVDSLQTPCGFTVKDHELYSFCQQKNAYSSEAQCYVLHPFHLRLNGMIMLDSKIRFFFKLSAFVASCSRSALSYSASSSVDVIGVGRHETCWSLSPGGAVSQNPFSNVALFVHDGRVCFLFSLSTKPILSDTMTLQFASNRICL